MREILWTKSRRPGIEMRHKCLLLCLEFSRATSIQWSTQNGSLPSYPSKFKHDAANYYSAFLLCTQLNVTLRYVLNAIAKKDHS